MVVVMEDTIMIRLSFEDDEEILSPSQKSEGLNLCWLLLKPQLHKTIADLIAHILHGFQLHNSCPHGIHLYIDGFPLSHFESTGILSISDKISVRKKRATLSLEASLKGQEAGKYQLRGLEEGGNATSKKRKASANLHVTKKKKQLSALATANKVLKSIQDKVWSSQENIQKQEHNPKNKKQAKNGKDITIDFDKLPPLCNLPKAGDVIVYRLLELSSSWTPELSPFRVGKVSWCSSETGKLLLMSVDESDSQPDNSLYDEDGSLEIDFTALVDVRLLKDGSGCLTTSAKKAFGFPVDDAALVVPSATASNDTQSNVSTKNGEAQPGKLKNGSSTENVVDISEQVSEALKAKKAELSQERTENTWSHRSLKGSALGPTMALLRKKKQCSGVQDSVQDNATANKVQKSSHDNVEASLAIIQKQELNLKKKKQAENEKDNINTGNMKISADTKSTDEIQNNTNDALEGPVETKKISRSALRKKAKRLWQRELAKVEKQDETVQNGLQYSKETLAVSKADTSQQSREQTRPKSEQKNRNGKRDDGEPKGLNSRSARRKKAKRQWLRESKREAKRYGYGYADTRYANTRFLESRVHRYGYVDTRYADTRYANTRSF